MLLGGGGFLGGGGSRLGRQESALLSLSLSLKLNLNADTTPCQATLCSGEGPHPANNALGLWDGLGPSLGPGQRPALPLQLRRPPQPALGGHCQLKRKGKKECI